MTDPDRAPDAPTTQDSAIGVEWETIFNADSGVLELPAAERCVVWGAASPLKDSSIATIDGDVPGRLPQVAVINEWPTELRSVEFELDGDLMLQVPKDGSRVAVIVRSTGLARWIALTEGEVASLTAIDSLVGGTTATLSSGDTHFIPVHTRTGELRIECIEIDGAMVGWVEASRITVKGPGALHALGSPLDRPVEVTAGTLTVESRRIHVESTLYAGSIGKHTHIACETDEAAVVLGESLAPSETRYLTVEGGVLRIVRGQVGPLCLENVAALEIGSDSDPSAEADNIDEAANQAIASHLGYGLAMEVSGQVRELKLGHRAIVSGNSRSGFAAERITAVSTAEVSGLNAQSFNLYSAGILRDVRRLGLWVDPSTRKARRHFEAGVDRSSMDPAPAQFELAHQRKRLVSLAVDTQQDGHTLSVLREAEKDARRAALPWNSRERLLLEAWRRLLGYGERIGYPLLIGAGLIFLLGIGQIGWSSFWSREWWSGWAHLSRVESVMNFALPGVDAFGVDGIGGFWGVSAKVVSVVFLASAITTAIRVVKRGE